VSPSATEPLGGLVGRTIVTGVAGDDIHVMGIRLVEHALKSAGARVVSLGVMTPVSEFVDAAVETAARPVSRTSSRSSTSSGRWAGPGRPR
jgi:methanogenic corrinoid protein MtbC1